MTAHLPRHRLLALVVLLLAGLWVLTGHFASVGSEAAHAEAAKAAEPAPEVQKRTVAAVRPMPEPYTRQIRLSGKTEADKLAVLAARANGVIEALGVEPGRMIAQGTVVLRLEGAEAQAGVRTAEDQLKQATERLTVGEALNAKGSLPEMEITSRRAAKSAAEAALSQAQSAADRLQLLAPFAGTVDAVNVEIGEWVQSGAPIATLIALDPIIVKAEVSERDVSHVALGAKAVVRLVSGVEMEGTVRHIARQASDTTRTFAVEVALANPDGLIPSGMTAELRLSAETRPALAVPRSVLTISEEGLVGLRVVGDDNIARFAPVELIDDAEGGFMVAGVPEGVRVIVAGQDLVRNGDAVIVRELTEAEVAAARKAAQP